MSWIDDLGLAWPILQAPMAGAQGVELAAAVSEAGGLGALPAAMLDPQALDAALGEYRARSARPLNVNAFCHEAPPPDPEALARWQARLAPYYAEYGVTPPEPASGAGRRPFDAAACEVLEVHRPTVVSFHFGLPAPALLDRVKAWGARVLSSATTVEEARWLEAHGADAIIAQGLEAGGHRGSFLHDDMTTQVGTLALVPQVREAVAVPVIAAGGIAGPRSVAAARALGAAAVQVGTAFLGCPESTIGEGHRRALLSGEARHTALTDLYSGRPARGLVTRLMRELGPMGEGVPAFPLATAALAPLRAAAEAAGSSDFSPLWAGQDTSGCRAVPAARQLRWLAGEPGL
ncbi:NAD(P)H-dependent flavin oxidoreductase [Halomonas koreensis]|uniref:Propionate 3-nitronate monooxygenase n=1 Tax=Halomonas koreensis TaxID=245385 RepID=A0ABU1FYA3_9GAMM|nr:nitronate monooxygenase [Halomonas koreensis]MDR5865182.1 nitronate monooxygenase [Halomonas koreensis]